MKNLKFLTFIAVFFIVSGCGNKDYKVLGEGIFADIQTNKGDIIVKLTYDETPVTVANFVALAEGTNAYVADSLKKVKYYNGVTFHRVIKDFMIQGGDRAGNGRGNPGYRFEDEIVDSLTHNKPGILSMANAGPNTNGSQFFITHAPTPHLNGRHTVFGEVVKGMEVVDSIANVETGNADKPLENVTINNVVCVKNGKEAKSFDAPVILKSYFDEVAKREENTRKAIENLLAEAKTQKEQAEELPSGLKIYYLTKGEGEKPVNGQYVAVNYAGFLEKDGSLFDTSWEDVAKMYNKYQEFAKMRRGKFEPAKMLYGPESPLVAGFKEGLSEMKVGDKARIFIPSHLGYGPSGYGPIPPSADLFFDIEILKIINTK